MSAEQGYVTVSRGRERGMIFTDLPREELLEARRARRRPQSATELFGGGRSSRTKPAAAGAALAADAAVHGAGCEQCYRQWQRKAAAAATEAARTEGMGYAR